MSEEPSNGSNSSNDPVEKDFGASEGQGVEREDTGLDSQHKAQESRVKGAEPEMKKTTFLDKVKRIWAKTPLALLDVPTMQLMAKGALAPTIALAAYVLASFHLSAIIPPSISF